ncbi:MAG TPA: type IV toxin-antitoxin system AbiEi family antitoxin domain-containing protein [Streptosporangiaceae bacterium]|nr:type IV toxin-antitoxin system AbiEi family antitoxin domain-containing protein [Streptosporangiaceae bacterium]
MFDGLPAGLRDLAARQCGILTATQLVEAGVRKDVPAYRVAQGRWQRPFRGVCATFSGELDREALLWAAVLRAGPGAMLSHQSAAELARLTDEPSTQIHVTIPVQRRIAPIRGVVLHRRADADQARHPVLLPPQTRVEETVLDLAGAARTLDGAVGWVTRGLGRRLTTAGKLRDALGSRARMRWRAELTELLSPEFAGVLSPLEYRYHRDVERPHGLPAGTRQARFLAGSRTGYRDRSYDAYLTVVELDGNLAHTADERWRDIRRDNAAAAGGLITLRYGWLDVTKHPCQVAAEVAAALAARGFAGATSCGPGCPVSHASSALRSA